MNPSEKRPTNSSLRSTRNFLSGHLRDITSRHNFARFIRWQGTRAELLLVRRLSERKVVARVAGRRWPIRKPRRIVNHLVIIVHAGAPR